MDYSKYAEEVLKSTSESTLGLEYDLRFDVVDFIKLKLSETGKNQRILAQELRMKDSQLTRIMNAESNLTLETIARIFRAFGTRPAIAEQGV